MNLYGVFIFGVNIKYGLLFFVFLGSKVAYTSERVKELFVLLFYCSCNCKICRPMFIILSHEIVCSSKASRPG